MSEFELPSEFPDVKFILQWGEDSQRGLCCGIFGCQAKIAIRCVICNGGYCNEHKDWHIHDGKFNGVIIKNEHEKDSGEKT